MPEGLYDAAKLGIAALLIMANAFFVSAEFALVSVRRTRIEELIAQGNVTARTVKHVIQDPDRFIAATQLGITIASLGLGWVGEPAFAHLIEPLFGFLPAGLVGSATQAVAAGAIGFALITFLHVVVGELAPKSVALGYPEQTALLVSGPTIVFENLFRPVIWTLNGTGNAILKLLGLQRPSGHELVHSVEELKMLVTASTASGELEPVEREMVHRAFEFADRAVEEVMIPRTRLVAIEDRATLGDFLELFRRISHSRFPIYQGDLDNILGFVWVKDVLRALAVGPEARKQNVKSIMRNALFVPSTRHIGQLFAEMQTQKIQLAIAVDEYGGTAGMVTIEEMIEEIVGSIGDELSATPARVRQVEGGDFEAEATLRIDEVNDRLGLALPESENYETLAGLILEHLRRIPHERESVQVGDARLTVLQMKGPRIERVLVSHPRKKVVPQTDGRPT